MSGRLHDIEARIGTVRQLQAIVTAMRGIASARAREARTRLPAVQAHAAVIRRAMADVLAMAPDAGTADASGTVGAGGATVLVIVTPDQGFVGGLPDRLIDEAVRAAGRHAAIEWMMIGDRGLMLATARGVDIRWSTPMSAHVDDITTLADHLASAIYARMATGAVSGAEIVHARPDADILCRRLVPFDLGRVTDTARVAPSPLPPLITMPPAQLLAGLIGEHVFADLCEALLLAYAAENNARMTAMIAARSGIDRRYDDLTGLARRIHQDDITAEILELATGGFAMAGREG
ncbi:H+-transporting ATP synthase subunit gamma [Tistrella bauzanensis]|uniref:H+-transporting ATP synthase subunit gamma n=1 Tax=Tistrella bauzanensis TaxID=657419 RepID=A0ABQ1II12_9PROT|nr:F0F1 ATP synthase subunit gamma [Tistrella bauzanensis]GGB42392.1 H+-transporting ATP synthase subunit gamma [Tistrella bauzanensis]